MANTYSVDPNNERLTAITTQETNALNANNEFFQDAVADVQGEINKQIAASKNWANTQTKLQNEQTDFAIEKIEQQKAQAKADYTKEQSGAYVDYKKQSNEYGVNAEQQAAMGMANTGYSESSQVSLYNTYQNRVATARQSYDQAILNYNNAITEARLQNSSILAEIAYESLQAQLKLSLQGVQYKNQLLSDMADKKLQIQTLYNTKYQQVYSNIFDEIKLAEDARQFDVTKKMQEEQFKKSYELQQAELAEKKRQFDKEYALKYAATGGGSGGGSSSSSKKGSTSSSSSKSSGKSSSSSTKASKTQVWASGSTKAKTSGNATIDTKSVLALGRGPISGKTLAKLEDEGKVTSRTVGNKIVFTPTIKGKYIK